jgi:hypothetical protein
MGTQMTDRAQLRVADADREGAAEALRAHYASGRLNAEELEERLQAAYAARTEGDLRALFEDLPEPRAAGPGAAGSGAARSVAGANVPSSSVAAPAGAELPLPARRAQLQRRVVQRAGGGIGAFAISSGVWALTGSGYFWPVWVLVVVAISMASSMWHLWGPAPDLDRVERDLEHHDHHHHHYDEHHRLQVEDGHEHRHQRQQDDQ